MSITAGDKIAKPKAAQFIESGTGKRGVQVAFEFEEPTTGHKEHLSWVGWTSEAALPYTEATLYDVLGCNGNFDQRDQAGNFLDPNFVNYKGEVKLVVELVDKIRKDKVTGELKTLVNEQTGEVEQEARIKYVNSIGGSAYTGIAPEVKDEGLMSLKASGLQRKRGAVKNHAPQTSTEKLPF